MMAMGPVSRHLKKKLAGLFGGELIHVWLDLAGDFVDFAEALYREHETQDLRYRFIPYRWSYLETMLALEDRLSGIDPQPTLLYVPKHDEERLAESPLFEVACLGAVFSLTLDSLVHEAAAGQVAPREIEKFLSSEGISLQDADQWFTELQESIEDPLWSRLHGLSSITQLVKEIMKPSGDARLAEAMSQEESADIVWRYLEIKLGLPKSWPPREQLSLPPRLSDLLYVLGSWSLCAEFVADLKISPEAPSLRSSLNLSEPLVNACKEITAYLRENAVEEYENIADETEGFLREELMSLQAEQLGELDTFRFEEERLLKAALQAAGEGFYQRALGWAITRLEKKSFWLQRQEERRWAWELVRQGCVLGMALDAQRPSLVSCESLDEAAVWYVERCASVDQSHRRLEQMRFAYAQSNLPHFEDLQRLLFSLRQRYQDWLDALAREFNTLCEEKGYLPSDQLQQRYLFEQEIRPLTQKKEKIAYFLVDGLRYEMAQELWQLCAEGGAENKLRHRFAELPTLTAVGMNLLAPANHGEWVHPEIQEGEFKGMQGNGSFRIYNPETRHQAIHDRVGGRTCPRLSVQELLTLETSVLKKKLASAKILVFHYREIDKAGEDGVGVQHFEDVLRTLRAAWQRLRDIGICDFVFTSDHGFLLLDPQITKRRPHGKKGDANRRHILSPLGVKHRGEVRVSLRALRYQTEEDLHLMMPEDASVFESHASVQNYAHGGNSLQERLIPVLFLHHAPLQGQATDYKIDASFEQSSSIYKVLRVTVSSTERPQLALGLSQQEEQQLIEFAITADDVPANEEQASSIFVDYPTYQPNKAVKNEQGILYLPLNQECEILFRLVGRNKGASRIRLRLPRTRAPEKLLPEWLDIQTLSPASSGSLPVIKMPKNESWLDALPEEARKIFDYLAKHDSLSEAEAAHLLGKASAVRRFRNKLAEYTALAPFGVRIDNVNHNLRFVRTGEKV